MVKNKDESKEFKEKTVKGKKNTGYKEPKDPLTEKAPRHQAAALESKDVISEEVAISPAGKDETEKEPVSQDAAEVKNKEQFEGSVILRFKDSEKFIDAVSEFDPNLPLDFDENSFIVLVSNEKVDAFREFMKEKGTEEMPYINETDKVAEVQSKRSNRAIAIDKSIKANRVGHKENPTDLKDWAENPNTLDLLGVDAGEE